MNHDTMRRAWQAWCEERTGKSAAVPMIGPFAEVWMASWKACHKSVHTQQPMTKKRQAEIAKEFLDPLIRAVEKVHGIE